MSRYRITAEVEQKGLTAPAVGDTVEVWQSSVPRLVSGTVTSMERILTPEEERDALREVLRDLYRRAMAHRGDPYNYVAQIAESHGLSHLLEGEE